MKQLPDRTSTVVIGGGQAGLSVGYHLRKQGVPFVILDASERVGDAWRNRWDSLRLFTPAWADGLDGMPFPIRGVHTPTKDEMADYLESYAAEFDLPMYLRTRVTRLSHDGDGFRVETNNGSTTADNVVVAMASWQVPSVPDYAADVGDDIVALHAADYRTPSQLQPGPVLVVGSGNSGAEIALELSGAHRTMISGTPPGEVPINIASRLGTIPAWFISRVLFHRILTDSTPMGRKMARKHRGEPLVRTRTKELRRAGVESVARITGVEDGLPVTIDGDRLDVSNVIWCTGYSPGFDWIDLPIFGDEGEVRHQRGSSPSIPASTSSGSSSSTASRRHRSTVWAATRHGSSEKWRKGPNQRIRWAQPGSAGGRLRGVLELSSRFSRRLRHPLSSEVGCRVYSPGDYRGFGNVRATRTAPTPLFFRPSVVTAGRAGSRRCQRHQLPANGGASAPRRFTASKGALMSTNLYVGNLTFNTTTADLESLFAAHGEVKSAQVITDRETGRSRGFGFVEMATPEAAGAATDALNGHDVDGRALTVNEAKERSR